ncbi:MAG: hypothetical protein ACFE8O_09585 [Candidatus Hermodarchaeota archaeon]
MDRNSFISQWVIPAYMILFSWRCIALMPELESSIHGTCFVVGDGVIAASADRH